jgi:hypothetical protein
MIDLRTTNHYGSKVFRSIIPFVATGCLLFTCLKSKENPISEITTTPAATDTLALQASVDTLVSIIARGDKQGLKAMMSDDALAAFGDAIDALTTKELESIAEAMDAKEPSVISPTMAEYTLTIDGLTYTIAFTPAENGESWNIVQF